MDVAGDVFSGVAALLDDPEQDVMTSGYIRPFLQLAQNRLFENVYANPNISGAKAVVVLPNVPMGTTSLSSFMKSGQPLALLSGIQSMKEKVAGQPDISYRPMRATYDLPIGGYYGAVGADSLPFFNGLYCLAQNDILLPGSNQALDFRIFGEFRPVPIADEDTPLIPGTSTVLTHWTAELIGMTRGATTDFIAYHRTEKEQAIAEIFNNLVMHIQEIPTQQKPFYTGHGSSGW